MIKLEITGNSFAEINEQLLDVVKGIGIGEHTVSHAPSYDIGVPASPMNPEAMKRSLSQATNAFVPPNIAVSNDVEETKKKRRTKAEIEADKAEKLATAKAEVEAAQASHVPAAPIVIPPMPTTNHVVNIPAEASMVQQPVAPVVVTPAPVIAPPLNQTGAYNLQTFKANLVTIISGLLTSGKLNSEWIAKTAKDIFQGQDIWLWSANEPKIEELFNSFVEWNLIQKFEG